LEDENEKKCGAMGIILKPVYVQTSISLSTDLNQSKSKFEPV